MALRLAALDARAVSGDAVEIQQRLTELQGMVNEDQARVDDPDGAGCGGDEEAASLRWIRCPDDLDLAKAQLQLDTDELR